MILPAFRPIDWVLAVATVASLAVLGWALFHARLPGNDLGYQPAQPIAFSHRVHGKELEIRCAYCHAGARTSRHADLPSGRVCMSCHQFVLASSQAVKDEQWQAAREERPVRRVVSEETRKLLRAQGLDDELKADPRLRPGPVPWVRVARLPDFAFFHHGVHAKAGVDCRECHGDVESFDRLRLDRDLTMGACVSCHRKGVPDPAGGPALRGSTDCVACHR